ncbi:TIGR04282 family arsenosugar biosynthesis glycosyltransferase [Marixanthomonas spongiae]|uniref:Glycosyltransferase n=1 Tax=Marixanthomonas spongiae TaxID=2174845 RepID=A0A2U0I8A2_9FLAO|nr:TIGR04282 family arsenosugar biosynthesis glycosyltransferase [Marixanthomonas spongiae]PVW17333.1 glycosyltransferase [Marixanthomonas spongiae]
MGLFTKNNVGGDEDLAKDFHFPTSKKALIIFTRNPELGKVKTRLATSVGDESALKIYKFLVQHTAEITANVQADKFVYYSEGIQKEDSWDNNTYSKKLQQGDDLGIRMYNAFTEVFSLGYDQAIIIGSDMYDLTTEDLNNAFTALKDHDYVIGPAKDGGYYLLGMKQPNQAIFSKKEWGKDSVLQATLDDLKNETVKKLEERNDVDFYGDIRDNEAFQEFLPDYLDTDF